MFISGGKNGVIDCFDGYDPTEHGDYILVIVYSDGTYRYKTIGFPGDSDYVQEDTK